jgi:hypothetical protein
MAKRIGVLERDERLDRRPRRFVDSETAQIMLKRKLALSITAHLIRLSIAVTPGQERMTLRGFTDGELGIGNALPFFKVQNPLLQPTKLHYETPHAGDRGIFARHQRKFIRVSARSRHSQQFIAEAIRPLAPAALAGSF